MCMKRPALAGCSSGRPGGGGCCRIPCGSTGGRSLRRAPSLGIRDGPLLAGPLDFEREANVAAVELEAEEEEEELLELPVLRSVANRSARFFRLELSASSDTSSFLLLVSLVVVLLLSEVAGVVVVVVALLSTESFVLPLPFE